VVHSRPPALRAQKFPFAISLSATSQTTWINQLGSGQMLLADSIWWTWVPYFVIFGFAAFLLSFVLLALRWWLSPSLLVGPTFGIGLVWWVDRTETPTTTTGRVVLIGACVLGASMAVWPVAFGRWVHRVFRDAERRLRDQMEAERRTA
jgi:hypothetical protein